MTASTSSSAAVSALDDDNRNNHEIHGMAGKIRSSTGSDTYDLAGLSETTIGQIIHDAFCHPFDVSEMIRLTLIVGAGKLGRQKYDASATKAVTQSLQAVGFTEDRGASAVLECAGSFKLQHDTGKNLKTVVVFPRISSVDGKNSQSASSSSTDNKNNNKGPPVLDPDSVAYKVAVSSMVVFQNIVQHKCPTWAEKRVLLQDVLVDEIETPMKRCEQLLVSGQPLSSSQEEFYNNTCVAIEDKKQLLKDSMHKQVFETHDLTRDEMDYLLQQVQDRVTELESSSSSSSSSSNAAALQKAKERQQQLQTISTFLQPRPLPQLKHHAQLAKLWKQAAPLMPLHFQRQNQSGSKLMTPAETKKLGQLDAILDEIGELELDSRGWFESDDVFERRLQSCRREFQSKYGAVGGGVKSKNNGGKSSSTSNVPSSNKKSVVSGGGNGGFITARLPRGGRNTNAWMSAADKKALAIQTKKNRLKKGDVFGAMMASSDDSNEDDDDSEDAGHDSDGESSDDAGQEENRAPHLDSTSSYTTNNSGSKNTNGSSKNKKRKKSKKGGGSNGRHNSDDDKVLDAAVRANQEKLTMKSNKEKEKAAQGGKADGTTDSGSLMSLVNFVLIVVRDNIWPLVVAILTWIIGTMFGTSKHKSKAKSKRN